MDPKTQSWLNFNLTFTKSHLNLISTSGSNQPQPQYQLNSTSTITSTQYGCDIKATQSCWNNFFPAQQVLSLVRLSPSLSSQFLISYFESGVCWNTPHILRLSSALSNYTWCKLKNVLCFIVQIKASVENKTKLLCLLWISVTTVLSEIL